MHPVRAIHREAMEYAEAAFLAKFSGDTVAFHENSCKAFELEAKAAKMVEHDLDAEPTRATLFRSAAYLAIDCGKIDEAIEMVEKGLAGKPLIQSAEELRDL